MRDRLAASRTVASAGVASPGAHLLRVALLVAVISAGTITWSDLAHARRAGDDCARGR